MSQQMFSMAFRVQRFAAARDFLHAVGPFLLEREVEHSLVLGLAADLAKPVTVYAPPFYLAAVLDEREVVCGCALRTPPFKLLVTELPVQAVSSLVADAAAWSSPPSAVSGEEGTASRFADRWCQLAGGTWRPGFRQRLYRLDELRPPTRPAPGAPRLATVDDVPLVARWLDQFGSDAGLLVGDSAARARALATAGDVVLWIDGGEAVSMAAVTGRTPNGARVGFVYTPAARRRRGYASVCVADLSARLLAAGLRYCCLFTDLANPTSNAIYQRLGYRPVCDVVDCVLTPASPAP